MMLYLAIVALLPLAQSLTPKPGDSFGQPYTCDNPDQVINRKNTLLGCDAFTKHESDYATWANYVKLAWAIAFQETSCMFQGDFPIGGDSGKSGLSAEISLFRLNWGMITAHCTGFQGQPADAWNTKGTELHGANVCAAATCLIESYNALLNPNDNPPDRDFFAQHRGGVSNVGNSDDGYYGSVIREYFETWIAGDTVSLGSGSNPEGSSTNPDSSQPSNVNISPSSVINNQPANSSPAAGGGLGYHPGYVQGGDGRWYDSSGKGYTEGTDGRLFDDYGNAITQVSSRKDKRQSQASQGEHFVDVAGLFFVHLNDSMANWYQMGAQ